MRNILTKCFFSLGATGCASAVIQPKNHWRSQWHALALLVTLAFTTLSAGCMTLGPAPLSSALPLATAAAVSSAIGNSAQQHAPRKYYANIDDVPAVKAALFVEPDKRNISTHITVSDESQTQPAVVTAVPKMANISNTKRIDIPSIADQLPPGAVIVGEIPSEIQDAIPSSMLPNSFISNQPFVTNCEPIDPMLGACAEGVPLAQSACRNNWKPDGAACPWPADEYLCDGGDKLAHVRVQPDWTVQGLDQQDTIAHYDTADGRLEVRPSNKVCIYAPRFCAVRRIDTVFSGNQNIKAGGYEMPIGPVRLNERQGSDIATQPTALADNTGSKRTTIYNGDARGIPVSQNLVPQAVQDRQKAAIEFSDLAAVRLDSALKPYLAIKALEAITWTGDQKVQVIIDGQRAAADEMVQRPQVVFKLDPPSAPQLRITKVASTHAAQSGDTIDFILRFDNIGDQVLGNVTIVDSLVTRLEFVPGSEKCSLPVRFGTQENRGESLVLRWEILDPIQPGEGGVIVFKCKVR
jgi:uncharacterized repeat protein (TIGR01451 family)